MHIEVLLPNPYTVSIIHDELIYGDTFINPTDLGKNIKATYLSNVGEISLEYCIKTILEENKNATFHTIQYSRKQKRICFYTDTDLNTKKWQEKEVPEPKTLTNKEEMKNAIFSVFNNEQIYDQDCASVYEVLMLYRNLHKQTKFVHERISNIIKDKLANNVDDDLYCCIHDYEYDKHILPIHLSSTWSSYWDKYHYHKESDGTISEKKIEGFHNYNILGNISEEIKELIDFYLSIEETKTQKKKKIKSVNSNLFIDIDCYSIDVYTEEYGYYYYSFNPPKFKSKFYTYNDKPDHYYPNSDIITRLTGNEMEYLQKIYIKIDDCPLWIREQLYNKRREEILQRQRKYEEELLQKRQLEQDKTQKTQQEKPPQKKLSLFQKMFPRKKENN